MKAKYCMYCGHNLEDNDKLELCREIIRKAGGQDDN